MKMKVQNPKLATWAKSGGGLAVAGVCGEVFRWYLQAKEATEVIRGAAYSKAVEAGALQEALMTCQETVRDLVLR